MFFSRRYDLYCGGGGGDCCRPACQVFRRIIFCVVVTNCCIFCCAISLALGAMFLYCLISLAPVKLGIMCNKSHRVFHMSIGCYSTFQIPHFPYCLLKARLCKHCDYFRHKSYYADTMLACVNASRCIVSLVVLLSLPSVTLKTTNSAPVFFNIQKREQFCFHLQLCALRCYKI